MKHMQTLFVIAFMVLISAVPAFAQDDSVEIDPITERLEEAGFEEGSISMIRQGNGYRPNLDEEQLMAIFDVIVQDPEYAYWIEYMNDTQFQTQLNYRDAYNYRYSLADQITMVVMSGAHRDLGIRFWSDSLPWIRGTCGQFAGIAVTLPGIIEDQYGETLDATALIFVGFPGVWRELVDGVVSSSQASCYAERPFSWARWNYDISEIGK